MIQWLKKYARLGFVRRGWRAWPIYRRVLLLGGIVAVAAGLVACSSDYDAGANYYTGAKVPGGKIIYTYETEVLNDITFTQTLLASPGRSNVFWGNKFDFSRGGGHGSTGLRSLKNGEVEFVFSISGAYGAYSDNPYSECSWFSEEEGYGYRCVLSTYPRPITGHTYQFHLQEHSHGYYGVEVTDVTEGTSFELGKVRTVPESEISSVEFVTDYMYSDNESPRCGDAPYSRLVSEAPTATYNGEVETLSYFYSWTSGDCPGASRITIDGDQAVHEYGIGNSAGGELINSANDLCADVMNGSSEAGAQLVQSPCNNENNQVFVFASDGTLHIQNHCVDVSAPIGDGAPLVLAECNGSTTQQWRMNPSGIESYGDLTIGVENDSTSSGARLVAKKIDYTNSPYVTKWTFNTDRPREWWE